MLIAPTQGLTDVLEATAPAECVEGMIGVQTVAVGRGKAAVVTLSRPAQHNALTYTGWTRIATVFHDLCDDLEIRVVIVRGAGDRAFSSGADISEFPSRRLSTDDAHGYNSAIATALRAVQAIPMPVIAMIRGLAVGGGCELAAACDVRIASSDARFGIPIGKLGVTLGLTETRAVAGLIGAANLKYLIYSGALIPAGQASGWGLVQEVVEPAQLIASTVELASKIVSGSEVTFRAAKLVGTLAADPSIADDDERIQRLDTETYSGADLREGVDAFLNRRSATFSATRSTPDGRA